jgi:NAD(P)-dependent dehydrogenase (short-subunit alcohol dehydrogenase family)
MTNIKNIAIIGASGAIGQAFLAHLQARHPDATIHCCSRTALPAQHSTSIYTHYLDLTDEDSIATAAEQCAQTGELDLVLVTTGILHEDEMMPEKSLRDLSMETMQHVFAINTFGVALVAKHFLPHIPRERRSVFAALSARVGSISDNHIGGWYAYRASKAALNMIIRNTAIEMGRRYKEAVIIGLHPGTVDSQLSEPFQKHVPEGKLFSPDYATSCLLDVIAQSSPEQSGQCFAWDGQVIDP